MTNSAENQTFSKSSPLADDEHSTSGARVAAIAITICAFAARLWTAHGTFLNPDEALHIDLANQTSLAVAYNESLTASHPPLLTFVLYFWRMFGDSELWLRMPSVIAGTVFCLVFYKWISKAAGEVPAIIGLVFVSFLAPIVVLGAEIRQYALLLAFATTALYLLDEGFERKSSFRVILSAIALYFAMLSHYSAFWFAGALGIYGLFRIFTEQIPGRVLACWIFGEFSGVALAISLYKTHLAKLQAAGSGVLQGWMSDFFLRRSYYDPAHDHTAFFFLTKTFAIFQYFFGQLAIGDVMGVFFIAGILLLLRLSRSPELLAARRLALLILASFGFAWAAGIARVYPYSGTRHMAFLIVSAITGVSVAVARVASQRLWRGLVIALLITAGCLAFGKPRKPWISRSSQSHAHIVAAMQFIQQNVGSSELIFTDYQSSLNLAHYLCPQEPISFGEVPGAFQEFSCSGKRVVSASFEHWDFQVNTFLTDWRELIRQYDLQPGSTVWIYQAGWNVDVFDKLSDRFAELRDLRIERFGDNVRIFHLNVGQPMPELCTQAWASRRRVAGSDNIAELINPGSESYSSAVVFPSCFVITPKLP